MHIPTHMMWKLPCFQVTNLKVTYQLSVIILSNSQHLMTDHLPLPLAGFCTQGAYRLMKKTKTKNKQKNPNTKG